MSYDLKSALGWIAVVGVVAAVFSYALSLAVGAASIIIGELAPQFQSLSRDLLLWAFALPLLTPRTKLGTVVAVALAIYGICFVKAARSNGGFLKGLRLLSSGSRPGTLPNWLTAMPLLASGLLVIDVVLGLLQSLFGVSTGSLPPLDPVVEVTALAVAPIAEEIGFRITILGLVTAILVAIRFGKNRAQDAKHTTSKELSVFFSAFASPGYAKERVGLPSVRTSGWNGISTSQWIFLIITSTVFGAYHWPLGGGGGWGPGKFLTAAISGLALGVVYLAYGAFANILLHWFFDLYFTTFLYNGVSASLVTFGDLASLGAIALGVWSIIVGIYWLSGPKAPPIAPNMWQIA